MKDYSTKQPFGKDVMPHNKEAGFTVLQNGGANTKATNQTNGGAAKFTNPDNKPNTDTKRLQQATKSDASGRSSGGSFKGFLGQ